VSQLYNGPVIDPHHHLWDLSLGRHAWLRPQTESSGGLGDLAPLRRNYLPADYLNDVKGHNVVASIHVEASWGVEDSLGETFWLDTLDKRSGVARRYVAHVSLAKPDARAQLNEQAAQSRVVGVRDILSWTEDPARRFADRGDLMRDPSWRAGLKALKTHGLVFDLMVFASQLSEAARLVADFPDQLFVLEHCGSPIDRDAEGMRRWREGLRLVARAPNAMIKISDPVAYDHEWTLESLREVVMACIDAFGPARAMFGSDFPVAGLYAGFDELYRSFKTIVCGFSATEQRAMFHDTAKRVYRL
jgi:predicted TIM-barrel fold metal-dependent hydrolase